jgi:hypothetical protein
LNSQNENEFNRNLSKRKSKDQSFLPPLGDKKNGRVFEYEDQP